MPVVYTSIMTKRLTERGSTLVRLPSSGQKRTKVGLRTLFQKNKN